MYEAVYTSRAEEKCPPQKAEIQTSGRYTDGPWKVEKFTEAPSDSVVRKKLPAFWF